jgi:Flp pilus assembly protein TadD
MSRSPDEKVTDTVAREICQREGLKAVLDGSIVRLGTHYVLTLSAVNCGTGEALAREQREAASKEQVLATLADAASNLRAKLGESLPSIQKTNVPVENQVTTTSLEALRAYVEGMKLNSQGKLRDAVLLLDKAVALDPNFVAAYSSLRIVHTSLGDNADARRYAKKRSKCGTRRPNAKT